MTSPKLSVQAIADLHVNGTPLPQFPPAIRVPPFPHNPPSLQDFFARGGFETPVNWFLHNILNCIICVHHIGYYIFGPTCREPRDPTLSLLVLTLLVLPNQRLLKTQFIEATLALRPPRPVVPMMSRLVPSTLVSKLYLHMSPC